MVGICGRVLPSERLWRVEERTGLARVVGSGSGGETMCEEAAIHCLFLASQLSTRAGVVNDDCGLMIGELGVDVDVLGRVWFWFCI